MKRTPPAPPGDGLTAAERLYRTLWYGPDQHSVAKQLLGMHHGIGYHSIFWQVQVFIAHLRGKAPALMVSFTVPDGLDRFHGAHPLDAVRHRPTARRAGSRAGSRAGPHTGPLVSRRRAVLQRASEALGLLGRSPKASCCVHPPLFFSP